MPRKMSIEEAHEFLDSKPGWITLTTISADGYPHAVPLGYFRLGNDILMGVRGNTRKLKNIQGNPKVSLLLESGTSLQDIKGLMVQGTAHGAFQPRRDFALRTGGGETAGSTGNGPSHGAEGKRRLHKGDSGEIQIMGLLSWLVVPGSGPTPQFGLKIIRLKRGEVMPRLQGKVALISGGARGQGAVEARMFAQEGAGVVIGDILDDLGKQVQAEINETGGECLYVHLDVTSESEWQNAVEAAVSRFGKLDVLVNNAGIGSPRDAAGERMTIESLTEGQWDPGDGCERQGRLPGHEGGDSGDEKGRRRLDHQHFLGCRAGRRYHHGVWGFKGGSPVADQVDGHPVRQRGHPGQLGASGRYHHRHDRRDAGRPSGAGVKPGPATPSAGSAYRKTWPSESCSLPATSPRL